MTLTPLGRFLLDEASRPVAPDVHRAADAVRERHGESVLAIVFYGSALRQSEGGSGILDFYVLVRSYRSFHGRRLAAVANRLLPPNVYYLETPSGERTVRTKYAVLTLSAFERRTSARAFESLVWGRFSQPCAIVFASDDAVRDRLATALAEAARTMLHRTLALMPARFSSRDIWVRALQESYRTELRAERPDRAAEIHDQDAGRYGRIAGFVLGDGTPAPAGSEPGTPQTFCHVASRASRNAARIRWFARRVVGKLFSVLRLLKGALTFDGSLDYILGKIESHSGVSITLTPWQRRHPLLSVPVLAWRLRRRSAFR